MSKGNLHSDSSKQTLFSRNKESNISKEQQEAMLQQEHHNDPDWQDLNQQKLKIESMIDIQKQVVSCMGSYEKTTRKVKDLIDDSQLSGDLRRLQISLDQ